MKKILAIALSVLVVASSGVSVQAHETLSGRSCSHSHYILKHNSCVQTWTDSHEWNGSTCLAHYYIYSHRKECLSCHENLGNASAYNCTDIHDNCGENQYRCKGIH